MIQEMVELINIAYDLKKSINNNTMNEKKSFYYISKKMSHIFIPKEIQNQPFFVFNEIDKAFNIYFFNKKIIDTALNILKNSKTKESSFPDITFLQFDDDNFNDEIAIKSLRITTEDTLIRFHYDKMFGKDCYENIRNIIGIRIFGNKIEELIFSRLNTEKRLYHYIEKSFFVDILKNRYEPNLNWNYIPNIVYYNLVDNTETFEYKDKNIEKYILENEINPFKLTDKELELFNLNFSEELGRKQTRIP